MYHNFRPTCSAIKGSKTTDVMDEGHQRLDRHQNDWPTVQSVVIDNVWTWKIEMLCSFQYSVLISAVVACCMEASSATNRYVHGIWCVGIQLSSCVTLSQNLFNTHKYYTTVSQYCLCLSLSLPQFRTHIIAGTCIFRRSLTDSSRVSTTKTHHLGVHNPFRRLTHTDCQALCLICIAVFTTTLTHS